MLALNDTQDKITYVFERIMLEYAKIVQIPLLKTGYLGTLKLVQHKRNYSTD